MAKYDGLEKALKKVDKGIIGRRFRNLLSEKEKIETWVRYGEMELLPRLHPHKYFNGKENLLAVDFVALSRDQHQSGRGDYRMLFDYESKTFYGLAKHTPSLDYKIFYRKN